jgi:hypothetical protein
MSYCERTRSLSDGQKALHRLTLQSLAWDEAAQALLRSDFPAFDLAMSKFHKFSREARAAQQAAGNNHE